MRKPSGRKIIKLCCRTYQQTDDSPHVTTNDRPRGIRGRFEAVPSVKAALQYVMVQN